jgi:hypothetical protein
MLGLRFTDGTTTITVSDLTTGILTGYRPGNAGRDEEEISDQAEVVWLGGRSLVMNNIGQLERFFNQARERKERPSLDKIYVERDLGDAVWWRSEIVEGSVLVEADGLDALARKPQANINIIRKNYWESAEAQIALSNGNGTNNTSGLVIFNCSDGVGTSPNVNHNYASIAAGVINGDAATPVRLEMYNNYNSASRLYTVWMAHNVESDPLNFQHILEAENAAFGGTDTVANGYSGGKTRGYSWSGDSQTLIGRWALDMNYLNRAGGEWFKVLAVLSGPPTAGIRLQCKITFPSGTPLTVIGSSQEAALGNRQICDIGALQIPPWLAGAGNQTPVDLCLYARRVGGGSLGIDFLQITPLDSYRVLEPAGYGAAYGITVVDDGINNVLYTDGWSPGGKTGHYVGIGNPILLKPSKAQRIYFLMMGDTGGVGIARTMSIKAFYRPRRVAL